MKTGKSRRKATRRFAQRRRLAKLGCLLLVVVATLAGSGTMAQGTASGGHDEIAFARAAKLKRGINLSMWYAQAQDYSAHQLETYTTAADFKLVHDLGFDHVRLSINPVPLIADEAKGALLPEAMARLDETVKQITATGLVVVLDIHPDEGWKRVVTLTDDGASEFFLFWKTFAQHFADTDPQKIYFEVLNEPEEPSPYRWEGVQDRAIAVIRSQAPQHTIIATGANYGGIDSLLQLEPVRDDNVIYSFHDYDPMAFTHQGATWAGDALTHLRNVPYPSSPELLHPLVLAQEDDTARTILAQYGHEQWNIQRMARRIDLAAEWARKRDVPVWCGEFGAYKAFAPPADRARWISDMRTTLEKDGIGWDMWDYQGSFAMVTKKDDIPTADPVIVKALGLSLPKP